MRKIIPHILVLAVLMFFASWWGMSELTFYKSDAGLRFWQAEELVANGWQTFAINYEQRNLDPNLEFIPLYCAYSVLDGEVYFSVTPFLPLLASFFYAWLGIVGLPIVPLLAGVATAVGVYQLARLAKLPHLSLIFWSSVIATPLFFYAIQLWDHSLAMASGIWTIYGVALGIVRQRWQPIALAGPVLAFGLAQRPEMYMMALALGVALLIVAWPRWQWGGVLAGTTAVAMLPVFWLQQRWIGHPLGIMMTHLSDYGRPEQYVFECVGPPRATQVGRFLLYANGQELWSFTAALLVVIGLFAIVFWLRLPQLQTDKIPFFALIIIIIGYAMWGRMLWVDALAGLITTFPLFGLTLAYVNPQNDTNPYRPVYRLTLLTAFLFLAGMLAVWPAYGGNHFGARYLLPLYPPLIFLAFYVYDAYIKQENLQKMMRLVGATLLILSVALQLLGLHLFWQRTTYVQTVQSAIVELPVEAVLTNYPALPTTIRGLDDQFFLYIDSTEDIEVLVPRLAEAGIMEFALLTVAALPLDVPEQVGEIRVRQISPVLYRLELP